MCNRIAVMLTVLAALGAASASGAAAQDQPPPHRDSAIVGGKRIQPRADEFSGSNAAPDVPKSDAKQLDTLYNQILQDSNAPLGSNGANAPGASPAPPPPAPKPR